MMAEANVLQGERDDGAPLTEGGLRRIMRDMLGPILRDMLGPLLQEFIQPSMLALEDRLMDKIGEVADELRPSIDTLAAEVAAHDETFSTLDKDVGSLQAAVKKLERKCEELSEKLASFEDRSRRNNLKFIGLPEKAEGKDSVAFIQDVLMQTFGARLPDGPPEIDRSHRTGRAPRSEADKPRPILARIHFYREKESILKLSREAGQLRYKDKPFFIFPDWSAETSQKRAAFWPTKQYLRNVRLEEEGGRLFSGIRYPATLWITHNGVTKSFTSPKESLAYVKAKFKATAFTDPE